MPVPELLSIIISEILVDGFDAVVPHAPAVRTAEQQRAFQKILVITIDRATDVAVSVGPTACFDVDPLADEPDLSAAIVGFGKRALCLFLGDGVAGELTERAKLDDQRSCFSGIADGLTDFSRL